ncbi:AraC family transcriptional regulator [Nocardia sp. CDC160]|uniref:AraC family transcriptional regulator n=1 Tax=Nocardia sp. CDC160 TaxID=3112166 RepID=UPI002DBE791B|nr:AraC family transcriptional regulator ligand-binding domain-containing protein [Nocardia sp. CDC160]MEC3920108.1 AraC family transcriptional regulator ligand-binding domain-containing protein [Nocardia sp. CDC160]
MGEPVRPSRWEIARPAVSTRYLLDTGHAHGLSTEELLAGTGLRLADLEESAAVVLPGQELRVIRNLLAGGDDARLLGFETGMRYSLTSTGMLGYAMLSSATVREALRLLRRFVELTSDFFDVTFTESTAGLLVEVGDGEVPVDVRPFLLVRDLVSGFRVASLLLSPAALELIEEMTDPVRLELTATEESDYLDAARALVGPYGIQIAIEFDAPRNAFTIPAAFLDRPTPAPDPHTAALCIQQCEALLDERVRFTGTTAQVRHLLLRHPAQMPTLTEVARDLSMSDRTLHRRLADEHTTFRAILTQVRQLLATELLAQGLTVEAVSRRLGYSDPAAFTHAYRRWFGHPPSRANGFPR